MACNCNSFRKMIEANFGKEASGKRKPDPEREYKKKLLLDREKEKQENENNRQP